MFLKKLILVCLFAIIFAPAFSQQNSFQPGWYVMEGNAKYFIVKGMDSKRTRLKAGQCLLVFEYDKGIYMCNDGFGRVIAVSGENALTKIQDAGRAGILLTDTRAANGSVLRKGAIYWIQSLDEAAGKLTLKSTTGKTETILSSAIMPYATYLSSIQKGKDFKDSE